MKIKRVDDKQVVIHTKEKAKLHVRAAPEAKVKVRNTLMVSRGPKISTRAGVIPKDSLAKKRKSMASDRIHFNPNIVNRGRGQYRGKTPDSVKRRYFSDTKQESKTTQDTEHKNYGSYRKSKRDREDAIKKKSDFVKMIGAIGTKSSLDQMEGGEEIQNAYRIAAAMTKPAGDVYHAGERLYRRKAAKAKEKQRMEKQAKSKAKKNQEQASHSRETVKKTTGQWSGDKEKAQAKKTYHKKAVKSIKAVRKKTASGTMSAAVTTGGGLLASMASNEAGRISTEKKELKSSTRNRMIQLFLSKLRQEENQDSIGKTLKDMVRMRFLMLTRYLLRYAGMFFAALFGLMALIAIPVIAVIAIIYNSPFAIFFPSISSGDTTQKVLSAYMQEFNRKVDEEETNYEGYDRSEKVYLDFEGAGAPDNYLDVLAVYMVKYGDGEIATDMTAQAKENLKKVFDDMCSYQITSETETEEDEEGNTITISIKYVNISLKTYRDMIPAYDFDAEEQKVLEEMMKPEYLALLGYTGGGGDPGEQVTDSQYQAIVDGVSDANGKAVVEFVLSKVGYPYSQAYRDTGEYYDCSSLAYYAWKSAGVDISYEGANTAASEGKYCYDNNLLVGFDEMQPGDLIFYSYGNNGRFMNITHVAIYVGGGKVVEAANERIGVVYRSIQGKSSIVFIGRPR